MEPGTDPYTILGDPTKGLFIDMLTRDISLSAAIVDLVDNSTDGARRLCSNENYSGLSVRIEVNEGRFKISDNCGGIPVALARQYAFRIGRASGMEPTPHSIGQFGVGMKRAIFKMGYHFTVDSKTALDSFVVNQDIRDWADDSQSWDFRFAEIRDTGAPEAQRGTTIIVSDLRDDVAKSFANANWRSRLRLELRTRLQETISAGLAVTLNGVPINVDPLTLLSDDRLKPALDDICYDHPQAPANLKLWCGLGPSEDAALSGWHIFCNGRLVLEADKTDTTGWGSTFGAKIPRFHPQYNHFRGYAFFECDDAGRLPWNTTKTGVDLDSPIYRAARQRMGILARPVISFLNALKAEKMRRKQAGLDDPGSLETIIKKSDIAPLRKIAAREAFVAPAVTRSLVRPNNTSIQYNETVARVTKVKEVLKVRTNKDVGLGTFEYFYRAEVEE